MVKKNREVWRKMGLFGPDSDPANQLQKINAFTTEQGQPIVEPSKAIEWALSGGSTQRERGGSALKNIYHRCLENNHGLSVVTDGLIWELKNGKVQCRSLDIQVMGASIHLVFTNL